MKIKHSIHVFIAVISVMFAHYSRAGWNYGSRSSCAVFAKYRVEVHAGWHSSQPTGAGGNLLRDTGCGYAHAGPLRYYTSSGGLLSEAEGYIGKSAFWGYAHAWNLYDGIPGIYKQGVAAEPSPANHDKPVTPAQNEKANAPAKGATPSANECRQSSSNHFYFEDVRFDEPKKPNQKCITIKNLTGHLVAGNGYSVLEITVWKLKDDVAKKVADTEMTAAKTIWHCRAVVHENRLATEGEFPKELFVAAPPASPDKEAQKEVVYAINNKDMTVTLPATVNLDEVEISVKGDAGDESILQPKR